MFHPALEHEMTREVLLMGINTNPDFMIHCAQSEPTSLIFVPMLCKITLRIQDILLFIGKYNNPGKTIRTSKTS